MPVYDQDLEIPRGDARLVIFSIEDTGPDTDGPTNLLGKTIQWAVYPRQGSDKPLVELSDEDTQLRIGDAIDGVVELHLDEEQTSLPRRSNVHKLYVYDPDEDDRWTVTMGDYTLTG